MTFIDITGERPTPGLIAGYSILAVVALVLGAWAIYLGRSRLHYRNMFSVRVLLPLALLILALENAALASSGRLYDELISDDTDNDFDSYPFIQAIFVLQAFEVPILLIAVFELTYLVHKRRSVNFCGMYFDEGRRVANTAVMSCMLRNSIRSLALVLLVMGLMVNFDVIYGDVPVDELAGRSGWWPLFQEGNWDGNLHLLLSLIPTAVLTLVCFYLSIMLWRYGTESAMVVHSSMLNPWFYSFFGTLALAFGQCFGSKLYPIMSNTGMLIFITTILALMAEVDKDIVATQEVVTNFLVQVAQKGDQIRVSQSRTFAQEQIRSTPHDEQSEKNDQFSSEEKTMECLDITERISNKQSPMEAVADEENISSHVIKHCAEENKGAALIDQNQSTNFSSSEKVEKSDPSQEGTCDADMEVVLIEKN